MDINSWAPFPIAMEGPKVADVVIFVGTTSAVLEGESLRGREWVLALPFTEIDVSRIDAVKADAEAANLTVRIERIVYGDET